jgi:anti-anti-sigma regulatory factor
MSAAPLGEPDGPARLHEAVDWPTGTIRVRGRLTAQGADLVRGTAALLHRSGHARVTVDLRAVRVADDEARAALRALAADLRARSGDVVPPEDDR